MYLRGGNANPGSTGVSPVGEGVSPSRTFESVDASEDSHVPESSFRRDAETNRRDACATRTLPELFPDERRIAGHVGTSLAREHGVPIHTPHIRVDDVRRGGKRESTR